MRTAVNLLTSVSKGSSPEGLHFSDAPKDFLASLRGQLDIDCMASVGHSFGGGPACALPAELSAFKCGIGMDPYWQALLTSFREH